jgi:hypothetical protein
LKLFQIIDKYPGLIGPCNKQNKQASKQARGGGSFCQHGRQRSRCKDCGGSAAPAAAHHETVVAAASSSATVASATTANASGQGTASATENPHADILELNHLCWMRPQKSRENFAHLCVVTQAGQGEES